MNRPQQETGAVCVPATNRMWCIVFVALIKSHLRACEINTSGIFQSNENVAEMSRLFSLTWGPSKHWTTPQVLWVDLQDSVNDQLWIFQLTHTHTLTQHFKQRCISETQQWWFLLTLQISSCWTVFPVTHQDHNLKVTLAFRKWFHTWHGWGGSIYG